MDSEKIIFIILALVFSIFSMFMKSKKQKRTVLENEKNETDILDESDLDQEQFYKPSNVENLQKNANIYPKKNKKKQKQEIFEKEKNPIEQSKFISQNIDLETENNLLEEFEGSDLQKAFLYSEIFKNANI